LRGLAAVGNLRRVNNRLRIAGLLLLALLTSWLVVRGCAPEPQQEAPPAAPRRETFNAGRPLRVEVIATAPAGGRPGDIAWLAHELRYVLMRGQMRAAAIGAHDASQSPDESYLLRVAVSQEAKEASLALVAPDQVLEREHEFSLPDITRLHVAREIAKQLQQFLDAPEGAEWSTLLGAGDAKNYDSFTKAEGEIHGPDGRGFTRPPSAHMRARTIERLESVLRGEPRFARARALLAVGYLSLGGKDESSLTQLAESNAERAVALDATLADAQAALGLAALRRGEWIAAHERFKSALTQDPNSAPALEGLACLLADAGRHSEGRPFAERAMAIQPRNVGAGECLAYTADEAAGGAEADNTNAMDVQVLSLKAILQNDETGAARLLREKLEPQQFEIWAQPLLRAVNSPRHIPEALSAVTRAANDGQIDATTEILCGAALRQPEFVFNRMTRLQRRGATPPLRILWLPQTLFLRKHARFENVVSAAGLPAFWQEHGAPDICATEPETYGCATGREEPRKTSRRNE
jgi:tetratricopeptide (TPR) repeat protein